MNFLLQIDYFRKEINLQINKFQTYRTVTGGVLTLFMLVMALVAIWFFGKDIVYKERPQFLTKKTELMQFPYMRLTYDNFFFSVRIEDNTGGYVTNPKYFEIFFQYEWYEKNMTSGVLERQIHLVTPAVPCNTSHIDNETIYRENLDTFYCYAFNDANITIGGDWTSDQLGLITFFIQKCGKSTEDTHGVKCATDEEYYNDNGYLDLFYAGIKHSNFIVNPSSLDQAITRTLIYSYLSLNRKFRKQNLIFYTGSILETDQGWFFPDVIKQDYTSLERSTLDFINVSSDNYVFECVTYLTKLQNYNIRNYLKIQNVAADVGGIMSLILWLMKLLYSFYVDQNYWFYLFETLVKFMEKTEEQVNENENDNLYQNLAGQKGPAMKNAAIRGELALKITSSKKIAIDDTLQEKDGSNSSRMEAFPWAVRPRTSVRVDDSKPLDVSNSDAKTLHLRIPEPQSSLNSNAKNIENSVKFQNLQRVTVTNEQNKIHERQNSKTPEESVAISDTEYKAKRDEIHNNLQSRLTRIKSIKDVQTPIKISQCDLFMYLTCRCFSNNKVKNQLIFFAQSKIEKNLDLTNLIKTIEQFKLLKKVFFNPDQSFMLKNKGKIEVCNDPKSTYRDEVVLEDDPVILEHKFKLKKENLVKYFRERKESETISKLDEFLLMYLDEETKQYVRSQAGVEDFC